MPVYGSGYDPSRDYDMPTSIRQNARRSSQAAVELAQSAGIDTLDIPAFLRKQAD
jgi:cell division protein FtsZ